MSLFVVISRFSRRKASLALFLAAVAFSARADSLDLVNGDHYQGAIVSVNRTNVEFQSDILGRITLPRDKVASLNFGKAATPKAAMTNAVAPTSPTTSPIGSSLIMQGTNRLDSATAAAPGDAVLRQMRQDGIDPGLVNTVQQQVFGQGNPAAAAKFNELMDGLLDGTVSVADIRTQAQQSIQEIKDAKQQLGPDAGDMLDGYLAILEDFVAESATNDTITPVPATPPAPTVSHP